MGFGDEVSINRAFPSRLFLHRHTENSDLFLTAFLPRPGNKRRAAFLMLYPPVPISFLGTGLMGKPMAMNLIKSGYQVTVWNRTPSKAAELMSAGARLGKSPAEAPTSGYEKTESCCSEMNSRISSADGARRRNKAALTSLLVLERAES